MKYSYPEDYEEKCRKSLELALMSVPAYHSWNAADVDSGDIFSRYAKLPFVDKAMMRKHGPEGFIPEGKDLRTAIKNAEVEIVNTSGSTGDCVSNIWFQPWWDASERFSWKLNKYAEKICTGRHREAILSSPLCVGFHDGENYLHQSKRSLGRFLFLNEIVDPSRWTEKHMLRMISEINEYQPEVMEANPSYLAHLSRFINKHRLKVCKPALITFTYENPSILHRRQIDRAFGVPLASSYGSTETAYVFMQCECGCFHQNVEHCHVDFIPFSKKHGGPLTGSILVTTFDNPWRSLIRFDIGDIVTLAESPCPCGRSYGMTLKTIEGRAVNLTLAPNGHSITQSAVDYVINEIPGIDNYQLIQLDKLNFNISYVSESNSKVSIIEADLETALEKLYGDKAKFEFKRVDGISPDPPGKYRLTKSLLDLDVKNFWEPNLNFRRIKNMMEFY